MSPWQAAVLAVVEGFSEFLPISSTGHMIIASSAMGISHESFTKMFTVAIQFGAILSVVVLYWRRFFRSLDFYLKLLIGFLPAAVVGKLLNDRIDALLDNVLVVAAALLAGGVAFLFIDRWFRDEPSRVEDVSYRTAFWVGCFQVIAMIPGVSRSAATIIGGLSRNLTRKAAAEFSFFLAVPTMFAATCYKLYKYYDAGGSLGSQELNILLLGNAVAFVVAMLAIKSFVAYLGRHGFKLFGYYRIALGTTLIVLHLLGVPLRLF